MRRLKSVLLLFILVHFSVIVDAQNHRTSWVDSVYKTLTTSQRIAQLCVIRAWSWKDSTYQDSLAAVVKKYSPGGVCFFKGSPVRQADLTNRLNDSTPVPLLVAIDAEWGLGMRLDSAFAFPRQMALGAISDDSLIYQMGEIVGRDCRRLGVQMNFAPVADVNNNPLNPVIGFRSFGEDPKKVAAKSVMYMKGMQKEGIMTTAKHFPGHGDTDFDSHYSLPLIQVSRQRLDSVELYPFRELIRQGVVGVMIAHLFVPAIDSAANTATTLSEKVVDGLLKKEMGFGGFVVTDALDMQGVTKFFTPGQIEVRALQAGNDILLLPQDMEQAINGIRMACDSGQIDSAIIESRCKRMLGLKYDLGLSQKSRIITANLAHDLNRPESSALAQTMVNQSLTLLGNDLRILPLTNLDKRKIALVAIGDTTPGLFESTLQWYGALDIFRIGPVFPDSSIRILAEKLIGYDAVIAGIFGISSNVAINFGLNEKELRLIDTICRNNRTIVTLFGTPYALNKLKNPKTPEAILVAYQDNPFTQKAAAEAIFGGIPAEGKLPVSASVYRAGTGVTTEQVRMSHVMPEEMELQSAALNMIDSLALDGIRAGAYPGCQVLFAKNGRIFYDKAFGTPRYGDSIPVTTDDLYDLASVTKVAATTLAVMKLTDDGKISPEDPLVKYLPELKGSNKARLSIGDVMAHQAGLMDWIPFYKATLVNGTPSPLIYADTSSATFSVQVAEGLFMRSDYRDTILKQIINSPLRPDKSYKYSDLGFYLLNSLVEKVAGMPFDQYLTLNFYKPLGLDRMLFNPLEQFSISGVMPTENDTVFRKQWIRGYVHDPGAAMLGGISGHAGLFGNAGSLAVLMQLLLNKGTYGGKSYFAPSTVEKFTHPWSPASGNRRAIGFDKPLPGQGISGPACQGVSEASYGHSGFTGTYVWADPDSQLIYVFLSNRICPDAGNTLLSQKNIRTSIHQAAIDLLQKYQIK